MNERPDNYMLVRTTKDIDEAVKQNKLGHCCPVNN